MQTHALIAKSRLYNNPVFT